MKSRFLSVYRERPYDRNNATSISIKPLIPESNFNRLPATYESIYDTATTNIIKIIGLLTSLNRNESGPKEDSLL